LKNENEGVASVGMTLTLTLLPRESSAVDEVEVGKRGTGEKGSLRDCMFTSKMMGSRPFFLGLPEKWLFKGPMEEMSRSSKAEFCWKVFANEGLLEDPEASSSRDKGSSFTELMAGKRERIAGRQAG